MAGPWSWMAPSRSPTNCSAALALCRAEAAMPGRAICIYWTVDPAGTAGTATLKTSALSFNSGSTLKVELNSPAAYDQLAANGTVSLNGASLQVTLGYTPTVGQQFTLIDIANGYGA